jgi:hypothetical protein
MLRREQKLGCQDKRDCKLFQKCQQNMCVPETVPLYLVIILLVLVLLGVVGFIMFNHKKGKRRSYRRR